jgi:hypothetical protein
LRGRALAGGHELVALLRFRSPGDFTHDTANAPPVNDRALEERIATWMRAIIGRFNDDDVTHFLAFATGRRTISALRHGDPERDAISICVYADPILYHAEKAFRQGMTASTCSRVVWLPWRPEIVDSETLENDVVRRALDDYAREDGLLAGGAAMDYE